MTVVLLTLALGAAQGQPTKLDMGLERGDAVWRDVTEGEGGVSWEGEGAKAAAVLHPKGGYAGISAPLEGEVAGKIVNFRLTAAPQGEAQLQAYLGVSGEALPESPVWVHDVPAGKNHKAVVKLAPPVMGGETLYLHIGARCEGTVRLTALEVIAEPLGPAFEALEVTPSLPEGWQPDGILDAEERQIGDRKELLLRVGAVQFSVPPAGECTLGSFAPLSALVRSDSGAARKLELTGEFPEAIAFDRREYAQVERGTDSATLRIQGLLPGEYVGRLSVASGNDVGSLPLNISVKRGYPTFGTAALVGNEVAGKWQLREIVVKATAGSTADDIVGQVEPLLGDSPAMAAVFLDGVPGAEALTEAVKRLAGRVALYSAAFRPNRPFTGDAPQEEAERLLSAAMQLRSVVSVADPTAARMSPLFDHSAETVGTPEYKLLDACLKLGLGEHFHALAVTSPPVAAGGALAESQGKPGPRAVSGIWAALDIAHSHYGTETLLYEHDVPVPILTSAVDVARSVDERLDGLKVARLMALSAYTGATGVTFRERQTATQVGLLDEGGALTPAGLAVRELSRELAGTAPLVRSWSTEGLSGRLGEPVLILPFAREREGIAVLWNNTSARRPVTITLGLVPYSVHTTDISLEDGFLTREYAPRFQFSAEAQKAKRQDVDIVLEPLQIKVLRYRFRLVLPTWLDRVDYTPEKKGGPGKPGRDDRPWWQQMQGSSVFK